MYVTGRKPQTIENSQYPRTYYPGTELVGESEMRVTALGTGMKQLGLDLPEQRVGSGRRGGAQWDTVMRQAREQAEIYAKRLPLAEGWPPFLVIVDIGHVIELYADFSLQGKHYAQFPDRQSYRIYLEDLRDAAVRERLRLVWTDPQVLNPARRTAEVTREIAARRYLVALGARLCRRLSGRVCTRACPVRHW